MQNYDICYSFDSNYVEQFLVSVASLLRNAKNNEAFNVYILDGGLTKEDKDIISSFNTFKNLKINYISLDNKDFKDCPLLKENNKDFSHYHVTLPTYYRFKLASLLPKIKNILYLDCDVIIQNSLEELFKTNLDGYPVAMVKDVDAKDEEKRLGLKNYFNAGVMFINLDFWRKENVEEKLFNYIKENQQKIKWQDQDIINDVLQNSIKSIKTKWNYQYFAYEKTDEKELKEHIILHLSGRFKPWLVQVEHPIYDIYYFYLSLTPFFRKIFEYKFKSSGKFLKDNVGGRETNILINATNKETKELYENIDKVYEYINTSEEATIKKIGKKINELYEEIQKNYNFVETSKKEIKAEILYRFTEETDKKVNLLYEEIKNNYNYIDVKREEIEYHIGLETDKKIEKIYQAIQKNYDYIEEKKEETIKEIEYKLTLQTEEKIKKIYEEISNNYKYTEQLRDEVKFYADQKEEFLKELILNTELETQSISTSQNEISSDNNLAIENKKLNERINQLEEELAICQINLAKLIKKLGIK